LAVAFGRVVGRTAHKANSARLSVICKGVQNDLVKAITWYQKAADTWDQSAVFPMPVLHELYADLDLLLLTATDDTQRWQAIVAGTVDVLDRFDHITDPKVICPTDTNVIGYLRAAQRSFEFYGQYLLAGVLAEPITVLSAQELVHKRCITEIRAALQEDHQRGAVTAITDAATTLDDTAKAMRGYQFRPFPP
jgi:hypothetical protein